MRRRPRSTLDLIKPNIADRVRQNQQKQKAGHDQGTTERNFEIGAPVYVKNFASDPVRHGPIMLFKLPIMLSSNASNFSLLCLNYAPLCPLCSSMLRKLYIVHVQSVYTNFMIEVYRSRYIDNSELSGSIDNSISLTISIDNRGRVKSMLYPWR